MIEFNQEVCGDIEQALSREWLETNGLGSFASSTITGLNTRRYHGMLVAATKPPVGRAVLLSKLEEVLVIGDARIELSSNQYPGCIHPQGFSHLKGFRLDPYPIYTFEVSGVRVEKHVCMLHGENTTIVQYRLLEKPEVPVRLEVSALVAFRDFHATTHENTDINPELWQVEGRVSITPYAGMPTLHFAHNAHHVTQGCGWYRSFEYVREQQRGLDYLEDLFNPCCFYFDLSADRPATVIASTEVRDATQAEQALQSEIARRRAIESAAKNDSPLARELTVAADQFIVSRGEHKTVIAGYHWFGDWGRDTMIALPGLTLATGRTSDSKDILLEFSQHVSQGMLPNRFPDAGEEPEYNTVDATLWYFEAVRAYHAATNDNALVRQLFPILLDVVDWHVKGTRYGIRMEEATGLLHAGESGVQLTWMDAKIGDWVVTPRTGKPVEIQALWYNALRIMQEFAGLLGEKASQARFERMSALVLENFNLLFWNEEAGCLYDVVSDVNDASIRPNQIFAVSLHYSILAAERAKLVVEKVQRELFTPLGLRTLSPSDAHYIGRYQGDSRARDAAYHQGTVWPWLMGPFVEAYLKVNGSSAPARTQVSAWLNGFADHLRVAGLGSISEIMDGDSPHTPCGCIAQAWSVAEVLRTLRLVEPESPAAKRSERR